MADKRTKEKWAVYAAAMVAFAAAVWVLTWQRGTNRTLALVLCYAVLVALAVMQTIRRHRQQKRKKKRAGQR